MLMKKALGVFGLLAIWCVSTRGSALETVPAGQVAAQWPLDTINGTTTPDVSGNNNSATLVNGPTPVVGLFRNALSFNGTNQEMTVPDSASLALGTGSFTVAAWIKPNNVANKERIVNKWNGAMGFLFDINASVGGGDAGGNLRLRLNDGTHDFDYVTPAGLTLATWVHIAATVDRTANQMILYANGVQVGTTQNIAAVTGSLTNTTMLEIGAQGGTSFYNGIMDEPVLYKRALSAGEITTLSTMPPVAPTGVTATPGVNQITLTWSASTGATSYTVLGSTTQGGPYSVIASGITALTYTNIGLSNPTVYYYVIDAVGVSGVGQDSGEVSGTPLPPQILVAPASLTVAENGGTAVFTVTLVKKPTANVTVPISSATPAALVLTAPGGAPQGTIQLVFTPTGALSQQVTVTGVQRFLEGPPIIVAVNFGTVASTDGNYGGAHYIPPVNCVITQDAPGIVVLPPAGLATVNGGPPITFTVQLATIPQGTAILQLSVSDPALATVAPLTISNATPTNAVTVTVTPLNVDPQTTYISPYDIIISTATSSDILYAALPDTLVPIDTPVSTPPLGHVWKCGLVGFEGIALLAGLSAWKRRRRSTTGDQEDARTTCRPFPSRPEGP